MIAFEGNLYWYVCRVASVYDGDTMRVDIDLGFEAWIMNTPIRLARIDTPEIRGEEREQGLLARDFLRTQLEGASQILINTKSKGKYGRWIAELIVDGVNINDLMLESGHAVPFEG